MNSLNRNYRALVNAADPKLSAVTAYVTAYAAYEIANGVAPPADDPVLGDAALAAALGAVATDAATEETVSWAKDVLGVGPAVGKIDQLRQSIELQSAIEANPPAAEEATTDADTPVAGDETAGDVDPVSQNQAVVDGDASVEGIEG